MLVWVWLLTPRMEFQTSLALYYTGPGDSFVERGGRRDVPIENFGELRSLNDSALLSLHVYACWLEACIMAALLLISLWTWRVSVAFHSLSQLSADLPELILRGLLVSDFVLSNAWH